MLKICVAGACGRMGGRILELASQADDLEIGGAFEHSSLCGREILLSTKQRLSLIHI